MNNIENSADRRIITLRNTTKNFGTLMALNDVSLSIKEGEEVTIMGPSGSGKTTLINLIAGLEMPTSGSITVNGIELNSLKQEGLAEFRRDNIGIVFQQFHLIPYLTAVENIMLAQYFHGLPDKEDAMNTLEIVGLKDRARHLPSELSGGEQQRVAIARAIANEPSIILADEPTGNLDEENEQTVLSIFRQLKDEGKTLILVTHNADISAGSDAIIRLEHGRIKQPTTPIEALKETG